MDSIDYVELFKRAPISDLNIGDTKFRRTLKNAGYATLVEAFDEKLAVLDSRVGFDAADLVDSLKTEYEKDPAAFARKAIHKEPRASVEINDAIERLAPSRKPEKPTRQGNTAPFRQVDRESRAKTGIPSMPDEPYGTALLLFEPRIRSAFDSLADRRSTYLAFEAFEDFATELDELNEAFISLFNRFKANQGVALSIAKERVPNAFILFCADQARSLYDGKGFWDSFFTVVGITHQNRQVEFKRALIECLQKRGMPVYGSDEKDFYYLYTALLHGGLSRDSWENLWQQSLLPMARKAIRDPFGFGEELNAQVALKYMRDTAINYSPGQFVLSVLNKAPDSTLLPLIDAALGVALKVENKELSNTGVMMLTSSGLPDTALDALAAAKGKQTAHTATNAGSRTGSTKAEDALVYLPKGSLLLDLNRGTAVIRWKAQTFPEFLAGHFIDFYVNGDLVRSEEISLGVGKAVLEGGDTPVGYLARYEVTIKLCHHEDGVVIEDGSLEQSLERTKPGCLEFIQMPNGEFRLRERGDRITRERRIAFVTNAAFSILAGPGMRPVERYSFGSDASDGVITVFEVSPGASGSIIRTSTKDTVATWHEGINVAINRPNVIGRTAEGLDVYPVMQTDLNYNVALPTVTIEASDGSVLDSDLDIVCSTETKTIVLSVGSIIRSEDGSTVTLYPGREVFFPWHSSRCDMTVIRRSTHETVLRYAFAVVPIRDFVIKQISAESMIATYAFSAMIPLEVTQDGIPERIDSNRTYYISAPLAQESVELSIASGSCEQATTFSLNLAGLSIEMNSELLEASRRGPISLGEALELGTQAGTITVTSTNSRRTRCVLITMGAKPLLFRRMNRPGSSQANLFLDKTLLLPEHDERPGRLSLVLTVFFGRIAFGARGYADIDLMTCYEGFGFDKTEIKFNSEKGHYFSIGVPAPCDLGAEVCWAERERVTERFRMQKGESTVLMPKKLVQKVDEHRDLIIRYFPLTLFGEPEREYTVKMPFKR